jgi:hypothetical protein
MTAAERLKLIRSKVKPIAPAMPKPAGLYAASHPGHEARKPKPLAPLTRKEWRSGFGPSQGWKVPEWVGVPEMRTQGGFKDGHRHGKHWLTRVAEGWRRP